jgi:hypothetical protein
MTCLLKLAANVGFASRTGALDVCSGFRYFLCIEIECKPEAWVMWQKSHRGQAWHLQESAVW